VQETSGTFGLHAGNVKFNTQNEDSVDISIVYMYGFTCVLGYIHVYIKYSKNILIIRGKNVFKKYNLQHRQSCLILAHFCKIN
jgi:hypothetical protein